MFLRIFSYTVLANVLTALILKWVTPYIDKDNLIWSFLSDINLNYAIVFIAVNLVVLSISIQKMKDQNIEDQNEVTKLKSVLKDIWHSKADSSCALWDYGKYGYSVIQTGETWQNWISYNKGANGLVATVQRSDLDYHDFGNEFYFFDLNTCKEIPIPVGDITRRDKVGNYFRNGMVVRLMPKN